MRTRWPRGSVLRNCSSWAGTRPASHGVKFSRNRFSQNSGFAASSLRETGDRPLFFASIMRSPSTVRKLWSVPGFPSALDADDLLQGVHDLDEVGLVGHDAVDVL